MKYGNFEDIPVWKDGIDLTARIFEITEDKSFRNKGDIANQLQRAGLSVPNNIAEGFERRNHSRADNVSILRKGIVGRSALDLSCHRQNPGVFPSEI